MRASRAGKEEVVVAFSSSVGEEKRVLYARFARGEEGG